jgi:hypothetical protein
MANPEWMEIFRSWDAGKLAAHVAELEKHISVYSMQGVGQKTYQKDLAELRGQLSAAVRIQTERGQGGNQSVGIVDFSGISNPPIPRWP